jgi:hypothetical protein
VATLSFDDDNFLHLTARYWCRDSEPATVESCYQLLRRKTIELAGADPTNLELAVAATAAVAWHQVNYRGAMLPVDRCQLPDPAGTLYSRAMQRWLQVARTLATIRRMRPRLNVQVNMAQNQIVANER